MASFLPRHLHYTAIPVHKNALLAEPATPTNRWPVVVFSHGLGGGRNSYSYLAGSLASYGLVVFCPEHRDGSAVISFVRTPADSDSDAAVASRRVLNYRKISHDVCPELYVARDAQIRIRLWEMDLLHDAILAMDHGTPLTNLNISTSSLKHFAGRLDVHEPGRIVFAGHSFGAATVCQFLKSTYYAGLPAVAAIENPLFTPTEDSKIRRQVTEKTVAILLDMWCLPLLSPNTAPLFQLPLPMYAPLPSAPAGRALLAIESEAFYKWTEHLNVKARLLSPDPSAALVTPEMYAAPNTEPRAEPNFFYVVNSAHLSQSDFGVLFPWLTKKIFDADQPERALRLNLRAQLQTLRENGIPVAPTSEKDLVDGPPAVAPDAHEETLEGCRSPVVTAEAADDGAILGRGGDDLVHFWRRISTIGLGEAAEATTGKTAGEQVEEAQGKMKTQLEPDADLVPAALATGPPTERPRRQSAAAA